MNRSEAATVVEAIAKARPGTVLDLAKTVRDLATALLPLFDDDLYTYAVEATYGNGRVVETPLTREEAYEVIRVNSRSDWTFRVIRARKDNPTVWEEAPDE